MRSKAEKRLIKFPVDSGGQPQPGKVSEMILQCAQPLLQPGVSRVWRLVAVTKEPANIARHLAAVGETTEVPRRPPSCGPSYWKSQVLRRRVLGDDEGSCGSHSPGGHEAA